MTFNNEQKQAEFDAFKAFCEIFAKRQRDSIKASGRNQLSSFAAGQYGGAAQQEIKKVLNSGNTPQPIPEIKLGKQAGGDSSRRNQSPGQPKPPKPGSARAQRLAQRAERVGRSAASVVVAGGETAEKPAEKVDKRRNIIKAGKPTDELLPVDTAQEIQEERELSERGIDDFAKGLQREDLFSDAAELSAKELVEKYGRDLIYDYLFNAGETAESLEQKTDRQLANILKKKVSEA